MNKLECIKTLQSTIESFDICLYTTNQVLKTHDQENRRLAEELAQQREENLETLIELQHVKAELANHKSYVSELKEKVLKEKELQHTFREMLWDAQRELTSKGHRVKNPINEIDMRLEELNSIVAKEGENST